MFHVSQNWLYALHWITESYAKTKWSYANFGPIALKDLLIIAHVLEKDIFIFAHYQEKRSFIIAHKLAKDWLISARLVYVNSAAISL